MISMATSRQSFAKIADQNTSDHRRQGRANHDPSLRLLTLDALEIDEANEANKVLPDLNVDALDEVAIDHSRLGHVQAYRAVSHSRLPRPA